MLIHRLALRSAPRHLCGQYVCLRRNGAAFSRCIQIVAEYGGGCDAEDAEGFPVPVLVEKWMKWGCAEFQFPVVFM